MNAEQTFVSPLKNDTYQRVKNEPSFLDQTTSWVNLVGFTDETMCWLPSEEQEMNQVLCY